jgi:hypothetical protein
MPRQDLLLPRVQEWAFVSSRLLEIFVYKDYYGENYLSEINTKKIKVKKNKKNNF